LYIEEELQASDFGAVKPGFGSLANIILVVNVVAELKPKITAAA